MQPTRKTAPLLALAALGLCAAPPVRAQTIDPFNSGTFTFTATSANSQTGGDQTAADVVGGNRTATVYLPYGSGPFTATLPAVGGGATVGPGYGLFDLGYGYRYNGGSSMYATSSTELHLNLTNADRLRFNFSSITGTVRIYATLSNLGGGYLSNGNPGDPSFTVSTPGETDLLFSDLRGSVNLSDVNLISLSLQPYGGSTFTLNNLSADFGPSQTPVPEPSTVAAFVFTGLGALGLILKARKRKPCLTA